MAIIRTIASLLKPRWALVALVLVAVWEGYLLLRPPEPSGPLDEPRREVAEEACWQAVEKLPEVPTAGHVAVLRLAGDGTQEVTKRLRELIERTGTYEQPEPGILDRVMEELKIGEREVGTLEDALAAARFVRTPYALFGRIHEFTSDRDAGRIRMELTLADVGRAKAVGQPIIVAVPDPEARMRWILGLVRVAVWVLVTALLPVVTLPRVRRILETESNAKILLGLLAYSCAAGVLALGLKGFSVSGWLWGVLLLGAVLLAFLYTYLVFSLVERRQ
ncbi:MAG: hypothetical protein AMK72_08125 [Planctomycetes bacterium SM23_25]|nr:MAG: hypothetical protein AMK72_08125 [Planctomycetes bacterium SM23_25]